MKLRANLAAAAVGLAVICGSAAHAGTVTVLSDNFDSENGGLSSLNYTGFANWNSTGVGGVDLVRTGDYGITCAGGGGSCVDLAGTPGPGEITSKQTFSFTKGELVTLSFEISGDQRNPSTVYTDFAAGFLFPGGETPLNFTEGGGWGPPVGNPPGFISSISQGGAVYANSPWTTYTMSFTAGNSGQMQVFFNSPVNGNIGPLLDNVSLSIASVPEPAVWAMLLLGFGLIGASLRTTRRRELALAKA